MVIAWQLDLPLRPCRGVLDTTKHGKVCQRLLAGLWFAPCSPISSTNKTDCHKITEILLKVALNTTTLIVTLEWKNTSQVQI